MSEARTESVPVGTRLYRVADPTFGMTFTWEPPARFRGGRFDSTNREYGFSYLADSPAVALAEVFTRDLPPSAALRILPASRLAGAVLLTVETICELEVQLLHGSHLTAIGQTMELTKSAPDTYGHTRRVAADLIAQNPGAHGLRYRPRHDEDGFAYMLYATDASRELEQFVAATDEPLPLAHGDGLTLAATLLAQYNVHVELPSTDH